MQKTTQQAIYDWMSGWFWYSNSSVCVSALPVPVCVLHHTICLRRSNFTLRKKKITFLTWSAWHGVGLTSEPLIWHSYGNFRALFFRLVFRQVEIFFVPFPTIAEQFWTIKKTFFFLSRFISPFILYFSAFSFLHWFLTFEHIIQQRTYRIHFVLVFVSAANCSLRLFTIQFHWEWFSVSFNS